MTPEQRSAKETKDIWDIFAALNYLDRITLLRAAGIEVVAKGGKQHYRPAKELINNCVVNWCRGNVPNFVELDRLTK